MSLSSIARSLAVVVALAAFSNHAFAASYDAIAVDDDTDTRGGDAGYGVGEGGFPREAEHEAVKNCREHNSNCKIVLTYEQCGAYASSRQHAGTGTGSSERAARSNAMDACGNGGCRIVVSDCVDR